MILFLGIAGREGIIDAVTCGLIISIILLLWAIDSYYLALERVYRSCYKFVRLNGDDLNKYVSMVENDIFELNPKYINEDGSIGNGDEFGDYISKYMLFGIFSRTNAALYSVAISIIVVTVNVTVPDAMSVIARHSIYQMLYAHNEFF